MMNGFRETLRKVLNRYGMGTSDAIGTVWSDGMFLRASLNAMGFPVEEGVNKPTYDYIILPSKKASIENVLEALTKINIGGIIVLRLDVLPVRLGRILVSLNRLNSGLEFTIYEYNRGILGVLLLGKEC